MTSECSIDGVFRPLTGLVFGQHHFPALKRWAIIARVWTEEITSRRGYV
jgi:hypothetical protein